MGAVPLRSAGPAVERSQYTPLNEPEKSKVRVSVTSMEPSALTVRSPSTAVTE